MFCLYKLLLFLTCNVRAYCGSCVARLNNLNWNRVLILYMAHERYKPILFKELENLRDHHICTISAVTELPQRMGTVETRVATFSKIRNNSEPRKALLKGFREHISILKLEWEDME